MRVLKSGVLGGWSGGVRAFACPPLLVPRLLLRPALCSPGRGCPLAERLVCLAGRRTPRTLEGAQAEIRGRRNEGETGKRHFVQDNFLRRKRDCWEGT